MTTNEIADAINRACSGDTIIIPPGIHSFTPDEPANIAEQQYRGAPLRIVGKSNITIEGLGNPLLRTTRHGSLFYIADSWDITFRNFTTAGNGYLTDRDDWYFAMFLLDRQVRHPVFENIVCLDYGNHGIGHLLDGMTHHGVFRNLLFQRGGTMAPKKRDGAAIACGGSDNFYEDITIEYCLVGWELENKDPNHETARNIARGIRISRPLWRGVFIYPNHLPTPRADLFHSNVISDTIIDGGGQRAACGIGVHGGAGLQIRGVTIRDLDSGVGIMLSEQTCPISDTIIDGARISGSRMADAIHIKPSNGFPVSMTLVTNCQIGPIGQGRGIYNGGDYTTITGNQVRETGPEGGRWEGIYHDGKAEDKSVVIGNTLVKTKELESCQ